jgi:hypothetical protein
MRKLVLLGLLVVAAIACGETAGEMLTDAGQRMIDAGDVLAPDAGAQPTDCCEDGAPGEPGSQGEQGPQGTPGPSGIVAATSFLGQRSMNLADVDGWRCEFGTEAGERLDVAAGKPVLITGQGSVVLYNGAQEIEFSVAWRQVGDTSNGTLGYFVEHRSLSGTLATTVHTTELTPPLAAGTYEFGVCVRRTRTGETVGARRLYGTAMVIDSGS